MQCIHYCGNYHRNPVKGREEKSGKGRKCKEYEGSKVDSR